MMWCYNIIMPKKMLKYTKNKNVFQKWLEWFKIFMKFVVSTKQCNFIHILK
jgi:hypothetical protein